MPDDAAVGEAECVHHFLLHHATEVEAVGLAIVGLGAAAFHWIGAPRVGVNGDEEVGVHFVGDAAAGHQLGALLLTIAAGPGADGVIVLSRQDDVDAHLPEEAAEALGDVQVDVFLAEAGAADGAGVVAAVSGINYDV